MNEVLKTLQERNGFVITGHRDPDGDSIGSSMALGLALEARGKRMAVVSADPLSAPYRRLPESDRVQVVDELPADYPVAVLMECSGVERTGLTGFDGRFVVNIDHHAKNPSFGDVNWIEPDVAATGVMVYWLLEAMEAELTPAIATHLYVAILTDTGSFRYSNTDATAFRVAAELLEKGVDAAAVASAVYDNVPLARVHLLATALGSFELEDGGRIASMSIPFEAFESCPGEPDTEGIVNQAQSVEGVSVAVLFKELAPGSFRVSLRSDGSADVAAIAHTFGGGGHPRAAGCQLDGSLEEVRGRLLGAVRDALAEPPRHGA